MLRNFSIVLLILCGLSFIPQSITPAADTQPYVYYYANQLNAIVVEHADGTDSRVLGAGLMPPNHSVIENLDWSASGEWVAWMSNLPHEGGSTVTPNIWIMRSDGTQRVKALDNLGVYFNMLKWSPKLDVLLVIFTKNGTLSYLIVDAAADKIVARADYQGNAVQYPEGFTAYWLERGDAVYYLIGYGDSQLLGILSVDNQTATRLFQGSSNLIWSLENGRVLRRNYDPSTRQPNLVIEDLNNGNLMTVLTAVNDTTGYQLVWSPKWDRALLIENQCQNPVSCQAPPPNRLWVVNWSDHSTTYIANNLLQPVASGWSPDSNFVLLQNADGQKVILNLIALQINPLNTGDTFINWQWLGSDNSAFVITGNAQSPLPSYFVYNVQTGSTQPLTFPTRIANPFASYNWNFPPFITTSPNGRYLGTRENNGMTYKIYDREQNTVLPWLSHSLAERGGLFTEYLWQPDNFWYMTGQRISFAGGGGGPEAVMILNVDGTIRRELGVCYAFRDCAGFVPDRVIPHLAKGSAESVIQQPITTLSFPHGAIFTWSPDSTQLATLNYPVANGTPPVLQLWDMTQNPPHMTKEIPTDFTYSGQESLAGPYLVWNASKQSVSVFDVTTYKTWDFETGQMIDSGKLSFALSPNRKYRWVRSDDALTIIDEKTNRELNHFKFQEDVNILRWSLDGSVLYVTLKDQSLILWESGNNTVNHIALPNYSIDYLADNDKYLVLGNRFQVAHVWDLTNQKPLKDLNFYPTTARFSPNGKYLAAATTYQISIWNTAEFEK